VVVATGIPGQIKARLVVQAVDRELTSLTTHIRQLGLQDRGMAAVCRARTVTVAQQVVAVLEALVKTAAQQLQQIINAMDQTLVRTQHLAVTAALVFNHQSPEPQSGTAVAAVAVLTRTPAPLTRVVLAAKVAAVTDHGVPTALVKMELTAQAVAVAAATVRVKAVMAEVALSSSRMFNQQPLRLLQSRQRRYVRQPQRLLLL
jgi:hypothetical protein